MIAGSLVAGAAYAGFAGEDINWDWQNYHEYNAFALIHGRFDQDVAPAGIQTFLNPLAYLPAYLLRHHAAAPFWGMMLGAIHGLNLALIYWLSRLALGRAAGGLTLAASVAIAAFGPMTLSEVGTSFADILTALPVIGGLGLILSANAQHRSRYAVAGLLMGAAVGLKLTNMIFFIGAGASLLYVARPATALSYFAVGGAIGALGTGGAWCWTLWEQFGNPVFPFYNTIFRSPEAPVFPIGDGRFLPLNLWDAAAYPFYWLIGDHRSSEGPFRDPRFAILVVLSAATAAAGLLRGKRVFTLRDKQFLLFFSVAYAIWLLAFSIHRYAIALELLAAPLIVLLVSRFLRVLPFASLKTQQVPWTNLTAGTAARHRALVATCGLVAPPVVRALPTPCFGIAAQPCDIFSDRKAGRLRHSTAAGRLTRLSTGRHPAADRAGGLAGPPHSFRSRPSATWGHLGAAPSRQSTAARFAWRLQLAVRHLALVRDDSGG